MWNHQWIVTVSFRIPPPPKKKCLLTKYSALRLFISVITITHWLFSTRPRRSKASMILLFCCIWSFTIFITFLFALTTRNYLQIKVGMNGIKSSESSIWEPASFSKKRHMGIKMRFFCQFYSINPLSIKLNYNSTSPKMAHDLQGKTALNV